MPSSSRFPIVLSLLLMGVGSGWLLTALGIGAGVNWIWTLGLAILGIASFVASRGIDKFNIIVGPIFLASSALSVARQRGMISVDVELPILVVGAGALLLIAQLPRIAAPQWLVSSHAAPPVHR
jgi:hypothetical protein